MGFLNWLKENPDEEASTGSQISLFDDSETLLERQRVSGVTVRKNFTKTIQDKGGDSRCQARSTEALNQEVLGCGTRELYQKTGAKRNRRETLPERAQEALLAGEVIATHDLKQRSIEGDQNSRNQQIEDSVRGSGEKVRGLFPW